MPWFMGSSPGSRFAVLPQVYMLLLITLCYYPKHYDVCTHINVQFLLTCSKDALTGTHPNVYVRNQVLLAGIIEQF